MITGTHFNYYQVCHRKLWLFDKNINLEQNSELVYEGKLIHETSYQQRSDKYREIEIEGIKIDYFDPKKKVVHEVKKSDKLEQAHEWQVKYYLFILEKNGIDSAHAILEYPRLKKRNEVFLSDRDREEIGIFIKDIKKILQKETCPPLKRVKQCRSCAYHDFCYINDNQAIEE